MIIEYEDGGKELLGLVEPLWIKLNSYHKSKSRYFAGIYDMRTFQDRINKFACDSNVGLMVDLARDKDNGMYVGYCVSTVDKEMTGEIDSLYIEEAYRGHGIGDELMKRAVRWLDGQKVKAKIVVVAEGNESALGFYKRFGFATRRTVLEQLSD